MVGGRLWGLIACHHNTPRLVPFETRTACEMLAEACATRLAALESFAHGQAELSVRRLQQRLVQAAAIDGDWRAALFETRQLLLPLRASGAALLFEGQVTAVGTAPGAADVSAIANWLCGEGSVTATASLSLDEPHFETLADIASGVLSVSLGGGDYLLWFRPERVRTITWGGEPHKPRAPAGPPTGANSAHPLSPADLSPRRSFAQWHQLVQRTSEPWLEPELAAARLIGGVVSDMIVHSRAMGLLVAHDQLDQVHQQLSDAGQPVLVAERGGRVLLANSAVRHLLGNPSVQQLDDLPALFQDRQAVAGMLQVLQERHVPWGGELALAARGSVMLSAEPISADPATSSSGPILGYVLTFVDLAPQKAAEAARARLQAGIADRTRRMVSGSAADATFEAVLTSVLQNAQLAAMEIADSADDEHMPERLDSLRRSVARTVHVLEQLLRPRHQ
jgi:PAS domain-containing protein